MSREEQDTRRKILARLKRLVRRFRWPNHLYANLLGYYWGACPLCGQMYGGHEIADQGLNSGPLEECNWRCIDETGKEFGTMTGYMQRGRCVCWQCGDKAAQLNRERDTSNTQAEPRPGETPKL